MFKHALDSCIDVVKMDKVAFIHVPSSGFYQITVNDTQQDQLPECVPDSMESEEPVTSQMSRPDFH